MAQDVSTTMNTVMNTVEIDSEMDSAKAAVGTAVLEPEIRPSELPLEQSSEQSSERPLGQPSAQPLEGMSSEFDPRTFSVDNYADRLMNDVFQGVEHVLETGLELPAEKPEPDYVSVTQIKMPEVALPLSLIPGGALAQPEAEAKAETEAEPEVTPLPQAKRSDRTFQVLCGLVLVSLTGAAATVATQWQSYRSFYLQVTGQAVPTVVATTPATPSPTVQFATYIQRSLEVLKDQTAIRQSSGRVVIAPPPVLQVPPAQLPSGFSAAGVSATESSATAIPPVAARPSGETALPMPEPKTVVERIYIPVYQTPNGYMPVDPNIQLSPEVAAAGVLPLSQPPAPMETVPPEPVAVAAVDAASQEAAPEAAQTPVPFAPAPSASAPSAPGETDVPATLEAPIISTYTLVGLLELGSGSAALIEVNGVTRRLSLGERIGDWSLAEVKNGEAVFRRNGEVRSVFVGQNF